MDEDATGDRAVLQELRPVTTACKVALVIADPGELCAGPTVALAVAAVEAGIDGDDLRLVAPPRFENSMKPGDTRSFARHPDPSDPCG